jgi:exopolyphosphatase/guanosine-5'-triphosphate,3'-diphosphate pyrophosphatase
VLEKLKVAVTAPKRSPQAVIDVGSNSVRLVVFDHAGRAPLPLFNEKALCGLGRSLARTGKLDEAGVPAAFAALRRFIAIARAMGARNLRIVATAAVRDASDGAAFVAEASRRTGVAIEVLSGSAEAELSAMGVVSGIPDADGLMGDLGGGSLEIVTLERGVLGRKATLPVGPFRLIGLTEREAHRQVDAAFAEHDWLGQGKKKNFYAVGGAWRALARIHMAQNDYPLRVVHNYRLSRAEAASMTRSLVRRSGEPLARIAGVAKRRLEILPLAALVLERLASVAKPREVVFSAFGLREGLIYASLPDADRQQDPLLAACRDIAIHDSRFGAFGAEFEAFIAPALGAGTPGYQRLRSAACWLSDVAWRIHPDHRGEYAFERIIHAPFAAIDHTERAILASAMFIRYAGRFESGMTRQLGNLIDAADLGFARELGLALRFAFTLSGGVGRVLADARLTRTRRRLILALRGDARDLAGEEMNRRFEDFAAVLDCTPEMADGGNAKS